jgi:hypothetical protein
LRGCGVGYLPRGNQHPLAAMKCSSMLLIVPGVTGRQNIRRHHFGGRRVLK